MSVVGKLVGSLTGSDKAAQAATTGAQISADAQREALAYLKETEKLPQALREGALGFLGDFYGIGSGSTPNRQPGLGGLVDSIGNLFQSPERRQQERTQSALNKLKSSPAYAAIMSSLPAGEEAILRNAGATGGLRSGNANDALARYSGELQREALFSGLQGIQGLAGLGSNANQIAATTAGIGQTLGQGITAAGQATAAGRSALISGGLGALGAYFSDARLKDNVKPKGNRNGLPWYTWTWNADAANLGLFGEDEGVMAHEVAELKPEAVRVVDNYLTVDYSALGVQ